MAVSHSGIGVVWGITTASGSITLGTGVGRITSETVTNDTKNMEHLTHLGELQGVTFYDDRTQLELEVYPSGSTISAAQNAANACPLPGSTVTLTDSVLTNAIGNSVKFLVMTSSVRLSNSDKSIISMTLVKAPGLNLSTNPIT